MRRILLVFFVLSLLHSSTFLKPWQYNYYAKNSSVVNVFGYEFYSSSMYYTLSSLSIYNYPEFKEAKDHFYKLRDCFTQINLVQLQIGIDFAKLFSNPSNLELVSNPSLTDIANTILSLFKGVLSIGFNSIYNALYQSTIIFPKEWKATVDAIYSVLEKEYSNVIKDYQSISADADMLIYYGIYNDEANTALIYFSNYETKLQQLELAIADLNKGVLNSPPNFINIDKVYLLMLELHSIKDNFYNHYNLAVNKANNKLSSLKLETESNKNLAEQNLEFIKKQRLYLINKRESSLSSSSLSFSNSYSSLSYKLSLADQYLSIAKKYIRNKPKDYYKTSFLYLTYANNNYLEIIDQSSSLISDAKKETQTMEQELIDKLDSIDYNSLPPDKKNIYNSINSSIPSNKPTIGEQWNHYYTLYLQTSVLTNDESFNILKDEISNLLKDAKESNIYTYDAELLYKKAINSNNISLLLESKETLLLSAKSSYSDLEPMLNKINIYLATNLFDDIKMKLKKQRYSIIDYSNFKRLKELRELYSFYLAELEYEFPRRAILSSELIYDENPCLDSPSNLSGYLLINNPYPFDIYNANFKYTGDVILLKENLEQSINFNAKTKKGTINFIKANSSLSIPFSKLEMPAYTLSSSTFVYADSSSTLAYLEENRTIMLERDLKSLCLPDGFSLYDLSKGKKNIYRSISIEGYSINYSGFSCTEGVDITCTKVVTIIPKTDIDQFSYYLDNYSVQLLSPNDYSIFNNYLIIYNMKNNSSVRFRLSYSYIDTSAAISSLLDKIYAYNLSDSNISYISSLISKNNTKALEELNKFYSSLIKQSKKSTNKKYEKLLMLQYKFSLAYNKSLELNETTLQPILKNDLETINSLISNIPSNEKEQQLYFDNIDFNLDDKRVRTFKKQLLDKMESLRDSNCDIGDAPYLFNSLEISRFLVDAVLLSKELENSICSITNNSSSNNSSELIIYYKKQYLDAKEYGLTKLFPYTPSQIDSHYSKYIGNDVFIQSLLLFKNRLREKAKQSLSSLSSLNEKYYMKAKEYFENEDYIKVIALEQKAQKLNSAIKKENNTNLILLAIFSLFIIAIILLKFKKPPKKKLRRL